MSIPKRMRAELRWLAQQPAIVWGGVYKQGGHPEIYELERRGFIEAVERPYTVGKLQFPGGYRITKAGRAALGGGSSAADDRIRA